MNTNPSPKKYSGASRFLATGWFSLTPQERWAILLVLGLFLLGLGARYWHRAHEHSKTLPPAPISRLPSSSVSD